MGVIFQESFDGIGDFRAYTKWNGGIGTAGGPVILAGAGRNGTFGARFFDHGGATIIFPGVYTGVIQAVALRSPLVNSNVVAFWANDGVNVKPVAILNVNTLGGFTITDGNGLNPSSSPNSIYFGGVYGQLQWKIETTWGIVGGNPTLSYTSSLLWNNVEVISGATGSIITGVHGINQFGLTWRSGGATVNYDDYYLIDMTDGVDPVDYTGDLRSIRLLPNAVGDLSDFTPSSMGADNYTMVNEYPDDGDATYVAILAAGKDLYNFEDISLPVMSHIYGVQQNQIVRKDNGGSRSAALLCRPTVTDFISPGLDGVAAPDGGISMGDDYINQWKMWNKNPDTSMDWTQSEFNAAQFGPCSTGP